MIEIREREIELKLRKATADRGGLCLKFAPSNWAGAPDRLVLLPGGAIGFVEVKAPGQSARPLQVRRHAQLAGLGCYVAVLDDPTKVNAVLDKIEQHIGATPGCNNRAANERDQMTVGTANGRDQSRMLGREGDDDHAKPG